MKRIILGAGLLAAASTAHAAPVIFASGKLNGGPAQTNVACLLYNRGTAALALTGLDIRDGAGTVVTTQTTCGTALAAGAGCILRADDTVVTAAGAYDCSVTVNSAASLRGSIEIRNGNAIGSITVLAAQALR